MTTFQKIVKYIATALAVFLTVIIISGALGLIALFTGISNADATADDLKTYAVPQDVKNIVIDINAANLSIKKGESLSIESNINKLDILEKNGTLKIKEKRFFGLFYGSAVLTITVPENASFESLSIKMGAGNITAESVNVTKGTVIESGIAKISVNGCSFNNLNLDSGVGGLDFNSKVAGKFEVSTGIGESNITLPGKKSDYSVDVDKGLGSIIVDGEKVSELETKDGNLCKIEVDGGIGNISLNFK